MGNTNGRPFFDWLLWDRVSDQLFTVLGIIVVLAIFAIILGGARRRHVRHERIRSLVGTGMASVEAIAAKLGMSYDRTVELLNTDLPRGLLRVQVTLPGSNCPIAIAAIKQSTTTPIPATNTTGVDAYVAQ